ncbi:hypothetical protein [Cellulophaga sp. 20_2_10]
MKKVEGAWTTEDPIHRSKAYTVDTGLQQW